MSGSRLGRGRGGRLAVYGVCGAVVLLLVFLYRAATSEMARLRDLHEQCAHQQEALAAQLQVIFEYKVRLEKSLAEEKSSNAAVKQELQQRATREKSLRDKDSVEAMQRFNSLQQTYKLLQTEHQDLQEECKKREKQALEETNRLETTLQDLRGRLRQAGEEKATAVETLKTKYQELDMEKIRLEDKYNELLDTNGNAGSTIEHLKKEASQLRHELDSLKKTCVRSTSPSLITVSPRATASQLAKSDSKPIPAPQQQQQQQVSSPRPLHAPRNYRADGRAAASEEKTLNDDANEPANDIRFVQRNGNIVPAGPSEMKEVIGEQRETSVNDFQQKQQREVVERPNVSSVGLATQGKNRLDEEQSKQVMSPPLNRDEDGTRNDNIPAVPSSQAEQPLAQPAVERASVVASSRPSAVKARAEDDELQALQDRVNGILNHNVALGDIR